MSLPAFFVVTRPVTGEASDHLSLRPGDVVRVVRHAPSDAFLIGSLWRSPSTGASTSNEGMIPTSAIRPATDSEVSANSHVRPPGTSGALWSVPPQPAIPPMVPATHQPPLHRPAVPTVRRGAMLPLQPAPVIGGAARMANDLAPAPAIGIVAPAPAVGDGGDGGDGGAGMAATTAPAIGIASAPAVSGDGSTGLAAPTTAPAIGIAPAPAVGGDGSTGIVAPAPAAGLAPVDSGKIAEAFFDNFKKGTRFPSKKALLDAANRIAQKLGFLVALDSRSLVCSRAGQTRKKKPVAQDVQEREVKRRKPTKQTGVLKCGCDFKCTFGYCIPSFDVVIEGEMKTVRTDEYRTTDALREVVIISVNPYHTNGCVPSYQQLVYQQKSAGKLLIKESQHMTALLSTMNLSLTHLSANTIRAGLAPICPTTAHLDADTMRNFRLWAARRIRHLDTNGNVMLSEADIRDMFKDAVVQKPSAGASVDDAEELYLSVLKDTMSTNQNSWLIEKLLKKYRENDGYFDYQIAIDPSSGAATAVVWQTGVMRADFELYGSSLFVDMMKRIMNSYNWPYVSIVVIDANGQPRTAMEGITCTERQAAYVFVVDCLFRMTPGRKKEEVLALFSDGILTASILNENGMNLPNCQFFWDQFHLLDSVWPKFFGGLWGGYVESNLTKMIQSDTKEEYEDSLGALLLMFENQFSVIDKIRKIDEDRKCFAGHVVKSARGALGKVSDNPAEQNHSSIVQQIGGALYEDPARELERLLVRHRNLVSNRNQEKAAHHLYLVAQKQKDDKMIASLSDDVAKAAAIELSKARQELDKKPFDRWKAEQIAAQSYQVERDEATGNVTVSHVSFPSKKRTILFGQRCECRECVQHLAQCRHEIAANGHKYCRELFDRRNFFYKESILVKRGCTVDGCVNEDAGKNDGGDSRTSDPPAAAAAAAAEVVEHDDHEAPATIGEDDDDEDVEEMIVKAANQAALSQSDKPISKPSFNEIMAACKDAAELAVKQGKEVEVYAVAVQTAALLRNGNAIPGDFHDVIRVYENSFSVMRTADVGFEMSQQKGRSVAPMQPASKPGSRQAESRIKSSMKVVRGNSARRSCTFCRKSDGHFRPSCKKKLQCGREIEATLLGRELSNTAMMANIEAFEIGGSGKVNEGAPKKAHHIVLHKVCSYQPTNAVGSSVVLVGVVSFLDGEGSKVEEWTDLPYELNHLRTIVETKFSGGNKCVFVPDSAYRLLSDPKLREDLENGACVGDEESSSSSDDDLPVSELAARHGHYTRSSKPNARK